MPPVAPGETEDSTRAQPRAQSLQAFLARMIWVCVLPLVLVSIYLAMDQVRVMIAKLEHDARDQVTQAVRLVDRQLREQIATLTMMAASPLLDDPPQWEPFYRAALNFRANFGADLVVADLSMRMLLNTRLPLGAALPRLPVPHGHAAVAQVLASGQPAVGDVFLGPIAKEPLVALAVPVRREEKIRYLLLSTIPTRHLQQIHGDHLTPTDGSITLFDGKGEVIGRWGAVEGPAQGEGRRFQAESLVAPWSVVLEIPAAVYRTPILSTVAALVAGILLVTLASLGAGRFTARRLGRAVASLVQAEPPPGRVRPIAEIEVVRERLAEAAAARQAAEDSRRESDRRFRLLFESAAVPLCFVSADGRLINFNRRFEQTFGYSPQEVPTLDHWWRLAHPEPEYRRWVIQTWHEAVARAFREGADITPQEYRVTCQDGRVRTMIVSGITLGEDVLATFFDITERERAERELRQSQAAMRGLLDSTSDSVVMLDLDHRVQAINEVAAHRLGTSVEAILGRSIFDFLPPELAASRRQRLEAVIASGQPVRFTDQRQGMHFDNHLYPVSDEQGRVTGVAIYARDITQAKLDEEKRAALEKQLLQAQKMEAIGTLAGGVAHDFNNILGAITGYTEMALDDARRGAANPADLEQVLLATERAKSLVRQILTFSRKVEAERKPLDLNREVSQAVQLLEKALPKMIRIVTDLEPDLLAVNANPNQMEQVLLNLGANAADAMPDGGVLTITTRNAELREQPCPACNELLSGLYVELTVSDTGQGMDPETLEHIFEPFFTTKDVGQGTGLGLSTVHGIVVGHGGHITCASTPGKGAIFTIHFPALARPGADQSLDQACAATPGGCERLLLVDDEAALLRLGARLLEREGYQ
ncbi:MAG: PAS domain S-box protein, partial [Desulfarculus sp.]|nr:PAS domain S-box protein [Desulfarculus sp.]